MSTDFNSNVDALFNRMESFVTTKTVVGEPVYIGGVILMPLVDVKFGVGAGAFDTDKTGEDAKKSENAGGGIGASITPSAVVVVQDGHVQLVNVKNQESINKLIDLVPGVLSKLNLGPFGKKEKNVDAADAENADSM